MLENNELDLKKKYCRVIFFCYITVSCHFFGFFFSFSALHNAHRKKKRDLVRWKHSFRFLHKIIIKSRICFFFFFPTKIKRFEKKNVRFSI